MSFISELTSKSFIAYIFNQNHARCQHRNSSYVMTEQNENTSVFIKREIFLKLLTIVMIYDEL